MSATPAVSAAATILTCRRPCSASHHSGAPPPEARVGKCTVEHSRARVTHPLPCALPTLFRSKALGKQLLHTTRRQLCFPGKTQTARSSKISLKARRIPVFPHCSHTSGPLSATELNPPTTTMAERLVRSSTGNSPCLTLFAIHADERTLLTRCSVFSEGPRMPRRPRPVVDLDEDVCSPAADGTCKASARAQIDRERRRLRGISSLTLQRTTSAAASRPTTSIPDARELRRPRLLTVDPQPRRQKEVPLIAADLLSVSGARLLRRWTARRRLPVRTTPSTLSRGKSK